MTYYSLVLFKPDVPCQCQFIVTVAISVSNLLIFLSTFSFLVATVKTSIPSGKGGRGSIMTVTVTVK